jgi:hypothetical protein
MKIFESQFEIVENLLYLFFSSSQDIFDSNRCVIDALTTIDKHIKLCWLYPGGFLRLLVFNLDTVNVDILLKSLNTSLKLGMLYSAKF